MDDNNSRSLCYSAGCSWCCGINAGRNSRDELTRILKARTDLYHNTVKNSDDILQYKEQINRLEQWKFNPKEHLKSINSVEEVIRCRLLGFIDDKETKVGCLAYNTPDARLHHSDIYEALNMLCLPAFGNICHDYKCQAAKMYCDLPDSLKDIVDIYVSQYGWYDVSNHPCKDKKPSIMQNLTTLAHYDYVLDRVLEDGRYIQDKVILKSIIDMICNIAHEILSLKDSWKYHYTEEKELSYVQYAIDTFPTGDFFTDTLNNHYSEWLNAQNEDSKYHIIIQKDGQNITISVNDMIHNLTKKIRVSCADIARRISSYEVNYLWQGGKVDSGDGLRYLQQKGIVSDDLYWYGFDTIHQHTEKDIRCKEYGADVTLFSETNSGNSSKCLPINPRLKKIFCHIDSYFVSQTEIEDAKSILDKAIDQKIKSIRKL